MDSVNTVLATPDTELRDIWLEGLRLLNFDAGICSRIEADIALAAKRQKAARVQDQQYRDRRTPCLFESADKELVESADVDPSKLVIGTGRSRLLDGNAVFLFLLCRGHLDSITTRSALDRLRDSLMVSEYLVSRGMSMPSRSGLWGYLDVISPETRAYIDQAMVRYVMSEGLDDMTKVAIDSFSVKANSAWPTDSGMLFKLLGRAYLVGTQMSEQFAVPGFTTGCVPVWLKTMKALDFEISCSSGKPNSKQAIETLYRDVLANASKIIERLGRQLETLEPLWLSQQFIPTVQAHYEQRIGTIFDCLGQAVCVCEYARERIVEGGSRPAAEKILSISDRTAAYIKKGGREAVIGYKPQVLRTANGFITVAELLQGNPADATRLIPVVEEHMRLTEVLPSQVTVDDGYSSRQARETLKAMGIEVVSMSGSKGRKLIPDSEWESEEYVAARNARSAVESVIWVLRHNYMLYRFSRCGLAAVKIELQEKVLVHNLWRCTLVRRRQAADADPAAKAAA
jgi:hypothetical protein